MESLYNYLFFNKKFVAAQTIFYSDGQQSSFCAASTGPGVAHKIIFFLLLYISWATAHKNLNNKKFLIFYFNEPAASLRRAGSGHHLLKNQFV